MAAKPDDKENVISVISQIQEVLARCSLRKASLERQTGDLRLLFRPWPVEKKIEAETTPQNDLQHFDATEEELLPEEIAELSLMDKAIVRAKKYCSKIESKLEREEKAKAATQLNNNKLQMKKTELPQKTEPQEPPIKKPTATSNTNASNRNTNATGTKANRPTSATSIKTNNRPTSATGRKTNNPPNSATGVISQQSINRLMDINKKPSGNVPPRAKGPLPVHAKAPFLTKTEVTAKKSTTHRSYTKPQAAGGKTTSASSAKLRPKSQVKTIHVKEANERVQDESNLSLPAPQSIEPQSMQPQSMASQYSQLQFAAPQSIASEDLSQAASYTQDWCQHTSSQKTATHDSSLSDLPPAAPKPFRLATDGSKLKIPASFGKTAATNQRLRTKIHRQQLKRRVSEVNTGAEHFIQAIEKHNASRLQPEEAELWQQVTSYTNAYTNLKSKLEDIARNQPTVRSSWEEVKRCQHRIGYIMNQTRELEESYQQLLHLTATVPKVPIRKPTGVTCNALSILPPQMQERRPIPAPVLCYKDKQSIHKYHDLQHSIDLLLLRSHLLNSLHQCLIPMLQKMDNTDSGLFRAAYSLLCTSSALFPSIVADDDEGGEPDEDYDEHDF